jgi:hypothetical protein
MAHLLSVDNAGTPRSLGMPIRVSRAEMQMAHRVPCQVSYQNSAIDP